MAKDKLYTIANVVCMGTALGVGLLIFQYAVDQLRYEEEFSRNENIYRIHDEQQFSGQFVKAATIPENWAPIIKETVPEVEQITRIRKIDLFTPFFESGNEKFYEEGVIWVDSTIFELFDVTFLYGDPKNALTAKNSIVITEEIALKYFGSSDAVDKALKMNGDQLYKVTAVVQKPQRSHMDFTILLPFPNSERTFWVNTYVLLKNGSDRKKTAQLIASSLKNFFQEADGKSFRFATELFPLNEIYLNSKVQSGIGKSGSKIYLTVFITTALLILIISSINFINLSSAKYGNRVKEIGVRKALGSSKIQLIKLVLTESFLTIAIATIFGFVLSYIFLPLYNGLMSESLHFLDLEWSHWLMILGTLAFVSLVAGLYPAYIVSNYNPILALKGTKSDSSGAFRKVLMTTQFILSFSVLFIGVVMKSQLAYLHTKDLGFEKERVLVVNARDEVIRNKFQLIKNDLQDHIGVEAASFCQGLPGKRITSFQYTMPEKTAGDEKKLMTAFGGDYDFLKTLDLELLTGRDFRIGNPTDTFSFILNESAASALGWEDPLQKKIGVTYFNKMGKVIGVVKDFHFESMRSEIGPAVIQVMPAGYYSSIAIKINLAQNEEIIRWLEEKWIEYGAKSPFSYYYLNTSIDELYKSENQVSGAISILSVIAVLLICVGLLSLVSFITKKRTREMGIRKVLGANDQEVVKMLGYEFLKLLLVSLIVSIPIVILLGNGWMNQFAFKARFEIAPYIQIVILIALVTALSIAFHVIKAAKTKPSQVLNEH